MALAWGTWRLTGASSTSMNPIDIARTMAPELVWGKTDVEGRLRFGRGADDHFRWSLMVAVAESAWPQMGDGRSVAGQKRDGKSRIESWRWMIKRGGRDSEYG